MRVLVIDGQGGRIGKQLIELISARFPMIELTAVGTNSTATSTMLKGGAKNAATGENAVKVAARRADVIMGPLGIIIADSLVGEISPQMAEAVATSDAVRILIPMNRCDNIVAGVSDVPVGQLIEDAVEKLASIMPKLDNSPLL